MKNVKHVGGVNSDTALKTDAADEKSETNLNVSVIDANLNLGELELLCCDCHRMWGL